MPPKVTDIPDTPKVTDIPDDGSSGGDRPPRAARPSSARTSSRRTTSSGSSDAPKQRTPADRKLAASVAGGYQTIGALITGIGFRIEDQGLVGTGAATINNSEMLAEAWMDLADKNPKVKDTLRRLTEVTTVGVLVSLHLATLMPLLIDRGVVPPGVAAMAFAGPDNGNMNGNGGSDT